MQNMAISRCCFCYESDYRGLQCKIKTCHESRGRNLWRQRFQIVDGETGLISGQRGGLDDARKLKTMVTKYN